MRKSNRLVNEITLFCLFLAALAMLAVGCAPPEEEKQGGEQQGAADQTQKMIAEMREGRKAGKPIQPLTATYGEFSIDEAYKIQHALTEKLTQDLGAVTGYKVAYASDAAQKRLGIDGPASSRLFQSQKKESGAEMKTSDFIGIIFETEVAFIIDKKIDTKIETVEALKPYVRSAHAAFDIGNNRLDSTKAKPTVADQVASGVGAHRYILGPAKSPDEVDVDKLDLKLIKNGETLADSPSSNVMGSPWNSLLWLAQQVVARGDALEPGDVILTGTAASPYKVTGDEIAGSYVGDCGALGQVTCTLR